MLGSIRRLTDAVGTVKQSYDYDPYGQPISLIVSIQNPYLFAGQYCDSESGLYYMRARYYDPNAGQFISRDPAVSRTRTAYSYASDSPINGTDPSGQCTAGLWHVAPALCLLEVLAPHLRGTPLASPLASASMAASSAVGAVQDHAVFGISECYGGCFNFQVQGGVASLQGGGVGYVWRGPYVGWANKKVRDRAKDSLVVSGCYYIGLSGSEGYPGGALPGDKADTEIDFTEGLGVQYGPMHTFASINLNPALGWVGSF